MGYFGIPFRNGVPIGLGSVVSFGAQQFDPSELFVGGTVNGAWYDPSDSTTLFSDRAGTTPCGTPGGGSVVPVGRMLDKSGYGNHAIAANDTRARPELRAVVNLLNGSATLATQSVTTVATTYTLYFTGSGSITLSGTATGTYAAGSSSVVCTAGTLTLTVSGTVTTADLRPANSGAQLPVYQARTDANTYDAVGFPRYLVANGTSSIMSIPGSASAMKFLHSDVSSVCIGANVGASTNPAALYTFFGSNTSTTARIGVFFAYDDLSGGRHDALRLLTTNGDGIVPNVIDVVQNNQLLPVRPNVVFYNSDPANATAANRFTGYVNNGSALAGNTGTRTPSTSNSYADVQLFADGANGLLGLMNCYGLIIVNATITGGQRTATQNWIANKMGVTLP